MSEKPLNDESTKSTEDRLLDLVERLAQKSAEAGLSPVQLETILTRVGISTAEGMRQTLKPENQEHRNESAYFTLADKAKYGSFGNKPRLSRKTFFIGSEEKDDRLMPAEIEEYNKITAYKTARNGRWKAEIRRNGPEEELWVWVPCDTVDQRMELPSLLLILMELNGGASTADIHGLLRKIESLKGMVLSGGAKTPAELEAELANV